MFRLKPKAKLLILRQICHKMVLGFVYHTNYNFMLFFFQFGSKFNLRYD